MSAWRDRGLAIVVSALAALLLAACGGGTADTTAVPPSIARMVDGTTLQLPVLQSGDHTYLNVRLALEADGTLRVLERGTLSPASVAAPDAVLRPALAPGELASAGVHARLSVRRMHIGRAVFHAAEIDVADGRWRYVAAPRPSTALVGDDFEHNADLVATHDHLMVLHSAPGTASTARIHLENRAYRFCMDAQAEGADEVSLGAAGQELVRLRAGDPCVTVTPRAGTYELRHVYGGLGSTRLVFFGRPAGPRARVLHRPQAPSWRAAASAGSTEYWALYGTWTNPGAQPQSGFLTTAGIYGFDDGSSCGALIGAFLQADAASSSSNIPAPNGFMAWDFGATLFDNRNFWQVNYGADGAPATLGPVYRCRRSVMVNQYGAVSIQASYYQGYVGVVQVGLEPAAGGSDAWGLTLGSTSLGFPGGPSVAPGSALKPVSGTAAGVVVQRVVQYLDGGLGVAQLPPEGSLALFNSNDCSGAALVVRAPGVASPSGVQGLPGLMAGNLGAFNGSLKLGPLTTATLYAAAGYQGESHLIEQAGCISQAEGWGTTGWKPGSLTIATNPVAMVFSTGRCEQCNLAGVDFTAYAVAGLVLNGSDLSGAVFTGTDLSNVQMQGALLHGATLDSANLYQANLCRASLNASVGSAGVSSVAASLKGANLHNANLNQAHLENVSFDNANFYGDYQGACSTDCSMNGCASAHGASINDAKFPGAFMSYVDMSGAQGPATFTNAVLVGALFGGANLAPDTNNATSFNGAFLMGADFSNAQVPASAFAGAYYDNSNSACWSFVLPQPNLLFPSVPTMTTTTVGGTLTFDCTSSTRAFTSTCVPVSYQPPVNAQPAPISGAPVLPSGFSSNGSCNATPPLCALAVGSPPGTQGYANQCWGPVPPLPGASRTRTGAPR